MLQSTSGPHDLNKRQMHSGQQDATPPDHGMWDQLQEWAKAKELLQLIAKYDKLKQLVYKTDSVSLQNSAVTAIPKDSNT